MKLKRFRDLLSHAGLLSADAHNKTHGCPPSSELRLIKMIGFTHPRINESILSPHARQLNEILKRDNDLYYTYQSVPAADANIIQSDNTSHQSTLYKFLLEDLIKRASNMFHRRTTYRSNSPPNDKNTVNLQY
jgi:hypothetical protein